MTIDELHIEHYFRKVVEDYNCGDIRELLDRKLDQIGPLLASTVNGIDALGGMMLGFDERSRTRSVAFMQRHLSVGAEEANLIYGLVRCGLAHEGISKLAVRFFVYYSDRPDPGVFLYKDPQNCIWLNVTELATSYLEAVERIGENIHAHLRYFPSPKSSEITTYRNALAMITRDISTFKFKDERPAWKRGSESPFLSEYVLNHFTVSSEELYHLGREPGEPES